MKREGGGGGGGGGGGNIVYLHKSTSKNGFVIFYFHIFLFFLCHSTHLKVVTLIYRVETVVDAPLARPLPAYFKRIKSVISGNVLVLHVQYTLPLNASGKILVLQKKSYDPHRYNYYGTFHFLVWTFFVLLAFKMIESNWMC